MTNKTWTWIAVVGLFLIGALVGWQLTNVFTPKPPQIKHDTITVKHLDTIRFKVKDTIYKTVHRTDTVKKNVLIHDTVMSHTDSIKIIKAFFKRTGITRIILDNDTIYLELRDSITQNQIISSVGKYVWKLATQTINNNPVASLSNQLYLGVKLDGLSTGFGIGGTIVLKTKRDAIWSAGVDYIPILSKQPIFSIGRNFKIKL